MVDGILPNILVLIVSLLVLSKSSHIVITNAVKVSTATGFGKTTIGFLLVAFATSLPELLVAIFAALGHGTVGVAVGNVLGANITNICLILGVCILLSTLKGNRSISFTMLITKEEVGSLYFGLFMASIIPLILLYLKEASQYIGVALLVLFIFNTYQLSKERTSPKEEVPDRECAKVLPCLLLTLLGVIGVAGSAYFLIDSASYIALALGVPSIVIGSTIVAFGTTVPEFATSLQATRQGHLNLAFGNIIGSGFVNLTCILGVTLIASPFNVNISAFSSVAIFSLISNLLLWYFISNERIGWREGVMLVFLYSIFLIVSFS
ncbi:MAG: sodium:calcium antiporter [Nitrososphaeria archaeon]